MLVVQKLSKRYGRTHALDGVDFTAKTGSAVGIVGPNGAGKSTLFSILAGIIEPDSGRYQLDAVDRADCPRRDIGFCASEPFFYRRFTGWQTVSFDRTMRQIEISDKALRDSLSSWDADSFMHLPMNDLSQGMRKRVMLTCAFLGTPKLIILDEPLNGLDIQGVLLLKDHLTLARDQGSHILLSSHVLHFIQEYTDNVIFLDHGRIVTEADPDKTEIEATYRHEFMKNNEGYSKG